MLLSLRALPPQKVLRRETRYKKLDPETFEPYEYVQTAEMAIEDIEVGNHEGKSLVAAAGLVFAALAGDAKLAEEEAAKLAEEEAAKEDAPPSLRGGGGGDPTDSSLGPFRPGR